MVQFNRLVDVISALRAPDGCPWDKEQTHRSLAPYLIEEAYECVEAIESYETGESGGDVHLIEELGDVLLQVVLHAQIASETGRFSITDVIQTLTEKMIRRHPHVFSSDAASKLNSADEVLAQWQEIKQTEKPKSKGASTDTNAGTNAGTIANADAKADIRADFGLPKGLPALTRAAKIGEKTARLKFDWPNARSVFEKVREEFHELEVELKNFAAPKSPREEPELGPSQDRMRHEIGDLLFSIAQLARHAGLEPEQCLRDGNNRFERRFQAALQFANEDQKDWMKLTQDEREGYWQRVKGLEKQ